MEITRLVFLWENRGAFDLTWDSFLLISRGGFVFDSIGIFYLNLLWLVLCFFPLHLKERPGYWKIEKWVYVVCNSIGLFANLADTVFFSFRQHRSTWAIFSEFGNDGNVFKIVGTEVLTHWYLLLLFILMVWALIKLYRPVGRKVRRPLWSYYLGQIVSLGIWIGLFIFAGRGYSLAKVTRPVSLGYAQRFATRPIDVELTLNTPFAMLRTLNGGPTPSPKFFEDEEEMKLLYNPEHFPILNDSVPAPMKGKNIVYIILESFGAEFVGSLNPELDNGNYKGFTPFVDSLMAQSVRAERMYSNSGFSIDALPSLLASTPRMRRPFVVSPYALNHITGIGELLGAEGYETAFFHGADNESLGLQAFTRQAGFKNYFGINEYLADPRTGGKDDFDGTWGIWDEKFLQYFRMKLDELPQPFVAGVFTLSSHHPFAIPEEHKSRFPGNGIPPEANSVRYADYSLRRFFEEAAKEPWYKNTLFIISADHACLHEPMHDVYKNDLATARIPIFLYDPSGTLEPRIIPGSMQQIDVLPTVLGLIGYDKPYFAFGKDFMKVNGDESWAVKWSHVPQIMMGDYVLMLNPESWEVMGMYDFIKDPYLRNSVAGTGLPEEEKMLSRLKAFIQTYSERQQENNVVL